LTKNAITVRRTGVAAGTIYEKTILQEDSITSENLTYLFLCKVEIYKQKILCKELLYVDMNI
jgi:hypothetical protein